MTVVRAYFEGEKIVGDGGKGSTTGAAVHQTQLLADPIKEALNKGICLNKAEAEIAWNQAADRWDQKGNKTDCALLAFAHDQGYKYQELLASAGEPAKLYPFIEDIIHYRPKC